MQEHGLDTVTPSIKGDADEVPDPIRSAVDAAK
jgi:hypothetical protein